MSEIEKLHHQFCQYSLTFKGNTPRTIKWFKEDFRWFIRFSGITEIEALTKQSIESWIIKGKLEKNWSIRTIRLRIQSLGLFLDWCVNEQIVKENPCKRIPLPKLPKSLPKSLTEDQAGKLLDWVQNYPFSYKFERLRAIAIISTFIYTGIRASELMNLKVSDVDMENKTLFVRLGKCGKDRLIPLHPSLIEVLTDYLKDRQRLKKCCPYFFTSLTSDAKMGESVVKRLVEKLRIKSGIYFYPHLLRHTFATLMLEGGCNLYALSKMMGHSDIKTTTIYLGASKAHLQEQIVMHPIGTKGM